MKMHIVDGDLVNMSFSFGKKTQNSQSVCTNARSEIGRLDQAGDFQIRARAMMVIVIIGPCMTVLQGSDIMTVEIQRMMIMPVIVVMSMGVRMNGLFVGSRERKS